MTKPRTFFYYYSSNGGDVADIRIKGRRKPNITTIPFGGTWVVRELTEGKWVMPVFPEITWGRLSKMRFIGKLEANTSE